MYKWVSIGSYLSSKLVGAGVIFLAFLAVPTNLDLYEMAQMARDPWLNLWYFFYGYAVAYSMVVDLVLLKLPIRPETKLITSIPLYAIGGFAPFLLMSWGSPVYMMIAGSIGVLCSFVFYGASLCLRTRWPYNFATALLLLILLIVLSITDFTTVKQWTETRTATSYEAQFDYFRGKKEIPIELLAGQTISYQVSWTTKSGGYGSHILDRKGNYVGMKELENGTLAVTADQNEQIRIVVTGDHLSGSVKVVWQITDPQ